MTFAKWMDRVNELCASDKDMAIHVLPEMDFIKAYAQGEGPEEFCERALACIRTAIKRSGAGSHG